MKKSFVFVLIAILFISFISAQIENLEQVEGQINDLEDKFDDLPKNEDELKDAFDTKWDYLQKEWTNILLKNKVIFNINKFFT